MIVLITHYNNHIGLKKSIESLKFQSNINILIVDDGSEIVPELSDFDMNNIEILELDRNYGIEVALNKGIEYILKRNKYKYIARLDCGDIVHKDRFKIQYNYMEENPEVYLLGSHVNFTNSNGDKLYTYKVPVEHKDIKNQMFIKNSFIHPAVVYRIDTIKKLGHYPTKFKYAEDYAFFFDITKKLKSANIDKILTSCEANENGISISNRKKQLRSRMKVILDNFEFNTYFMIGFFRNLSLLMLPNSLNMKLKKLYYK